MLVFPKSQIRVLFTLYGLKRTAQRFLSDSQAGQIRVVVTIDATTGPNGKHR